MKMTTCQVVECGEEGAYSGGRPTISYLWFLELYSEGRRASKKKEKDDAHSKGFAIFGCVV